MGIARLVADEAAELDPLVAALRAVQQEEGLSDLELATRVGISPSHWWRLYQGERTLGGKYPTVLQRAQLAFPAHRDRLVSAAVDVPTGNNSVTAGGAAA